MPRITQERRLGVRNRLLDAAAVCLARGGYEATGVREIAAEADLSSGALYKHFSGKHDLFLALIERYQDTVAREADPSLLGEAPLDVSPTLLMRTLGLAFRSEIGYDVLRAIRTRAPYDPDCRQAIETFNGYLVNRATPLVEAGQAAGFVRADLDPAAIVEMVAALYDGIEERAVADAFVTDLRRMVRTLMEVIARGIFVDDPAVLAEAEAVITEHVASLGASSTSASRPQSSSA
jgi:AcrR family transcriptional regulator